MSLQEATDVGFSRNLDILSGLKDIIAIVVSKETEGFKRNNLFIGQLESSTNLIKDGLAVAASAHARAKSSTCLTMRTLEPWKEPE